MITRIRSWLGDNVIGQTASGAYILKWQNGGKALVDGIEASMSFPLVKDRLNWNTNATWMITSEQKTPVILCRSSRNILSITRLTGPSPEAFSASVNWTLYGRQKPRTHAETRSEDTGGLSGKELGAYSLVGTNFNYDINKKSAS